MTGREKITSYVVPIGQLGALIIAIISIVWHYEGAISDLRLSTSEQIKEVEKEWARELKEVEEDCADTVERSTNLLLSAHQSQPYHTGMPPYVESQIGPIKDQLDRIEAAIQQLREGR